MNVAHIEEQSYIYGPGCRFVIWTQGCSIHCKGCWNQSMWAFEPNTIISVETLFEKICTEIGLIEGITLLGGEPLDQYEESFTLIQKCKHAGLSVMLFTGYELTEIYAKKMTGVFDYTDILITGRYEEEKRTLNHQWIGSTNQEIYVLSDHYKNYQKIDTNYIEISIENNGSITILGFPDESWI
ncbi:anaerobic ribonucleoside-triphosphate reductase-activating protein [Spirochaetia bacterium]|nr:anaerobic ribonucleoside-triphosphate reductase-activating protein [Spirochaetia bacterium]